MADDGGYTPILVATRVYTAPEDRIEKLASLKATLLEGNSKLAVGDMKSLGQALREDLSHNPKVISIFNFKSGVGKTTVAINVAGMLTGLDKRVLVIDQPPLGESPTERRRQAAHHPGLLENVRFRRDAQWHAAPEWGGDVPDCAVHLCAPGCVPDRRRNILISSDYILPPTFCDYFSLQSMHSFLKNLLSGVIDLLDDLRQKQAVTSNSGGDVYRIQMAYGHVVLEAAPKILPFVATNYKAKGIADPNDWVPNLASDAFFPHFAVGGPAKFILSMRQLCASPDLDSRVIDLLHPDGDTLVIPLVKQTNAIITHAQEEGAPAVLVHPKGNTGLDNEKDYMKVRFTGLCEFLISLP
ncbi:hypothetical protein T492DRAFT_832032 [Pavlovales sp. CCMP2436]|nr:hypothetical protein T492DRAFT_832032 [Pavlovales sp. CCMP2436]